MPLSGTGGGTRGGQAGSGPNTINYSTGATGINFTTAPTAPLASIPNMPGVQKRVPEVEFNLSTVPVQAPGNQWPTLAGSGR